MAAPHHEFEIVVVGAGVVGLAVAAALARAGRQVLVLERRAAITQETTSRNSQVMHAGIYHPPGSLKAELCCAGRVALYERCRSHRIAHRRIGKWIVATETGELERLESLRKNGERNGVPGLELVDARSLRRSEPALCALGALLSPETGIIDARALATSYLAEAEALGAVLCLRTELRALERSPGGWRVQVNSPDGGRESLACAALVNAAGLGTDRVAEQAGLNLDAEGLRLHFCKGDYFSLAAGRSLQLGRLVYPVPSSAGLGIHATLDLGGRMRFGPDAEYVRELRYDVDPDKAVCFGDAVRRYLPALDSSWLVPDSAGVRPRLHGPDEKFRDFVVREESAAGLPGLVSCIGIESPGLTAAPAIAARVVELLRSL